MSGNLTRFCAHCYALMVWETRACPRCCVAVEDGPRDFESSLIWALRHPDTATVVRASAILAARGATSAIEPLAEVARLADDPYRAEAAVRALRAFAGNPAADQALLAARHHAASMVRRAAISAEISNEEVAK